MAMDNIAHLLKLSKMFPNGICDFFLAMHRYEIIDELLSRLTGTAFTLYSYSWYARGDFNTAAERISAGAPSPRCAGAEQKEAASLMPDTWKLDVGEAHAEEAAEKIRLI